MRQRVGNRNRCTRNFGWDGRAAGAAAFTAALAAAGVEFDDFSIRLKLHLHRASLGQNAVRTLAGIGEFQAQTQQRKKMQDNREAEADCDIFLQDAAGKLCLPGKHEKINHVNVVA
ncbi:hypothetical protein DCC62_13140 [candidate division KSB1 bacterium]|nr:MAG: hypothetical protein DCC62_13140 [candidate division KSB1 bacterium]